MQRIPSVKRETGSPREVKALDHAKRTWGRELNITDVMAQNPNVLDGFLSFWAALDKSGLSHEDREVICMDMAAQNGCHYCIPAHLSASNARGVDMEMVTTIARGELLTSDDRAAKLQRLTRLLVETGGKLSDAELEQARGDGFGNMQLIAIIAEIAHCHFTNSFNRLVNTTADAHYPNWPID